MTDKNLTNAELPTLLTVAPSPHIKSGDTTRSVMLDVLIALLPAFVWGCFMSGVRAIAIGAISVASCVLFEWGFERLLHQRVTVGDCSAAVTGLLLAMNLSAAVPLWMPVVGAFFAIVIVKQLFGGIGKNIVNPALAARVFLFSWASEMTTYSAAGSRISSLAVTLGEGDITAGATPLASLGEGRFPDATIGDMFIGNIGGSIGEVSTLLLLLGCVYLLVRRVITWHIPVSFLGTVAVLSYLFPQMTNSVSFMLYELMAGGLVLAACFMATDYATSPLTPVGRLIYGFGCGVITFLIRRFGGYAEGASFAVLIMNLLVWYLDLVGRPRRFGTRRHESKRAAEEK